MKTKKYKAIVCLPAESNDEHKIISPKMYFCQNKEIILQAMNNDPDYDYIDENCYYYDVKKEKLLVKKSTSKNLDKFVDLARSQGISAFSIVDGFMWAKEWLKDIKEI